MKKLVAFLCTAACLLVLLSFAPASGAAETPAARETAAAAQQGTVNVNTAGVQELMTLPGIGPALAERIVAARKEKGPFRRVEDLLAVQGIGPKLLAKIKDRLAFEAPGASK